MTYLYIHLITSGVLFLITLIFRAMTNKIHKGILEAEANSVFPDMYSLVSRSIIKKIKEFKEEKIRDIIIYIVISLIPIMNIWSLFEMIKENIGLKSFLKDKEEKNIEMKERTKDMDLNEVKENIDNLKETLEIEV